MAERKVFVTGWSVAEAICKAAGIDYSTVSRIVIGLDCGSACPGKIYVQHLTTENLLKYDWYDHIGTGSDELTQRRSAILGQTGE